ncbi:uncharacterized protein LOC131650959 [Vicia villosa]|uniref:uncharacterized protein LOC131650959 n=1 Tax=Vicia villosa TaxID=3911 RepID=UPI00273A8C25|nr:uncharacterized protein LOC131650959 [Vicia villosa]
MAHPDNIVRDELEVSEEVNVDAKSKEPINDVKTIFVAVDWVRSEASKLGFGVVIARSDNDTSRRQAFVVMRCERDGKVDGLWHFSVISGIHNHALKTKLHGHPIVCRLNREEKDSISELSIIKVAPRNIHADLKRKIPDSVLNIKQVYNERYNLSTAKIRFKFQSL